MKILKSLKYKLIISLVVTALVAAGLFRLYHSISTPKKTVEVTPARIASVEEMVKLCSVDIYSEVPVLDTLDRKVMFAIQKQRGQISFDIENLQIDSVGDTLRVTLPKEKVELYESTDPHSWEVVDTKGLGLLVSNKFTIEEENRLKKQIRKRSIERLYRDGTVKRAREEAAANLQLLLQPIYRRSVIVEY